LLNIGERLREERARLGLNQGDFAAMAGVSKTTQFNYEKGERSPDADYLVAVAEAGVDVLYLLTGQRTPTAAESFSVEETQLVQRYRVMSPENRESVNRVTEALANYRLKE